MCFLSPQFEQPRGRRTNEATCRQWRRRMACDCLACFVTVSSFIASFARLVLSDITGYGLLNDSPCTGTPQRQAARRRPDHQRRWLLTTTVGHNGKCCLAYTAAAADNLVLGLKHIGCKLVLITNRKSYMSCRLVPKSVTLNDLERLVTVALRYFNDFDKPAFQHITASISGRIYARVYCIL